MPEFCFVTVHIIFPADIFHSALIELKREPLIFGELPHFSESIADQPDIRRISGIAGQNRRICQNAVSVYNAGITQTPEYRRFDNGRRLLLRSGCILLRVLGFMKVSSPHPGHFRNKCLTNNFFTFPNRRKFENSKCGIEKM
jgi:hypothetical protein